MSEQTTGLLLVNHGSHSATWRQALLDLEARVTDSILAGGLIHSVRTAHMEYTEPSIATQMKAFDEAGVTDVIVVPILLTVSSHSADDIPTIMGQKHDPEVVAELQSENIEIYTPAARTHFAPLLDFSDALRKNVLMRCRELSSEPATEGLTLIGYGDEAYDREWRELFDNVGRFVKREMSISHHSYGWCGHLVHYNPDETTQAVNAVLETKDKAIVIPVLVAYDDMFQKNIIGRGIERIEGHEQRVLYAADAILPDPAIDDWVVRISGEIAAGIVDKVPA